MANYRETQGELLRPFILSLLAEAQAALGDTEAAEAAIQEAIELARVLEANGFLPELLLRHARLIEGLAAPEKRYELLEQALKIAQSQGADAIAHAAVEAMRTN